MSNRIDCICICFVGHSGRWGYKNANTHFFLPLRTGDVSEDWRLVQLKANCPRANSKMWKIMNYSPLKPCAFDFLRVCEVRKLTLDVDGDCGLFAVRCCFVGCSAGDTLATLDVRCWGVERADRALSVTITQQCLPNKTTSEDQNVETKKEIVWTRKKYMKYNNASETFNNSLEIIPW